MQIAKTSNNKYRIRLSEKPGFQTLTKLSEMVLM